MTPEFKSIIEKAYEIYSRKGADYTIGNAQSERTHNFFTVAHLLDVSPMAVWSVYFYKHFSAVLAYAKTGKVESEGIEGRLLDIINYAILGLLIIEREHCQKSPGKTSSISSLTPADVGKIWRQLDLPFSDDPSQKPNAQEQFENTDQTNRQVVLDSWRRTP